MADENDTLQFNISYNRCVGLRPRPQAYSIRLTVPEQLDRIFIQSSTWFSSWFKPQWVETMHISCKSDMYIPDHNYAGVMIYLYNGQSEWRTANNTQCKSGYIVIQDTDSENVRKWIGKEPGQVHGAVYRNAFGESLKKHVVGEAFAVQNEALKLNSATFNCPEGSLFHDNSKTMHELSAYCIEKIVKRWSENGSLWARYRDFQVKELLWDFPGEPGFYDKLQSCNIL